jgi:hypothetical protein
MLKKKDERKAVEALRKNLLTAVEMIFADETPGTLLVVAVVKREADDEVRISGGLMSADALTPETWEEHRQFTAEQDHMRTLLAEAPSGTVQ